MKTKILFALVAALCFVTASTSSFAQDFKPKVNLIEYAGKSTKFAVMIGDPLHFKAAILTAEEMQIKKKGFKFEVVVIGHLAKDLAEDKSLLVDITKAKEMGMKIVVCEHALQYFSIDKSLLDKRLETTKNAWVYMFELKDKGYNTLGD